MVSKETEHFGTVLKSVFECDFMLFKFETPYASQGKREFDEEGSQLDVPMTDLEAIALARETDIETRMKSESTPMMTE